MEAVPKKHASLSDVNTPSEGAVDPPIVHRAPRGSRSNIVPLPESRAADAIEAAKSLEAMPISDDPLAEMLSIYHDAARGQNGMFVLSWVKQPICKPQKGGPKPPLYSRPFAPGTVGQMADAARALASHSNVYFGPALMPANLRKGSRGKEEDIVCVLALVLEEDRDKDELVILPSGIEPTLIVETSRIPATNCHFHFVFDAALPQAEAIDLAKLAHAKCGGDAGGGDVTHIWRLPETQNHPDWKKMEERGRPPEPQPVRLVGGSRQCVSVAELRKILVAMPDRVTEKAEGSAKAHKTKFKAKADWQGGGDTSREAILARLPKHLIAKFGHEGADRSKHAFSVLLALFEHGLTDAEVLVIASSSPFAAKYAERGDLAAEIARARARWIQRGSTMSAGTSGANTPPLDVPHIIITAGDHDRIVTRAMQTLVERNEHLYQRGNKLVRPVRGEGVDSRGNVVHFSVLMEVDEAYMVRLLCRNLDWHKPDGRVKGGAMPGFRKIDAPEKIARAILKSAGDWPFKVIAGILNAPTLRHDGSILSEPGYDARTHLYLQSSVVLPPIPEHPTRAQAEEALTLLTDLMTEIPFVNEASKSVALSMMLSTVARTMFEVAPAHGARAPTAGTGKSYCADIVAAIVLGERCPVISVSEDNDGETEKRIIAKAMNGDQIINLDNVNGTLGGDTLCQLTERPTCDLRPLGQSKIVRVENRSMVFFNGNNVRVKGDMTRRVIISELDRKMEKPAEYAFKNNPVKTVLANRGAYIAACLTILRAYTAVGSPKQDFPPMNSYGEWSACVRSALVWLGCADPCLTVQKARDEDPELQKIAAFCSAARPHIGREEFAISSRDIMKLGMKTVGSMGFGDSDPLHPELNEFCQEFIDRGKPNLHRLGNWLSKFQGRIVGNLRISSVWDGHKKVNRWFIESVGGDYAAA